MIAAFAGPNLQARPQYHAGAFGRTLKPLPEANFRSTVLSSGIICHHTSFKKLSGSRCLFNDQINVGL
jgi:hypothetical protein